MKVSNLIRRLQFILETEGDIEVERPDGKPITFVTVLGPPHDKSDDDLDAEAAKWGELRKSERLANHAKEMLTKNSGARSDRLNESRSEGGAAHARDYRHDPPYVKPERRSEVARNAVNTRWAKMREKHEARNAALKAQREEALQKRRKEYLTETEKHVH